MPLWSGLAQVFDKYGKDKVRLAECRQAREVLGTLDDLLKEALTMLNDIHHAIAPELFSSFKAKHSSLFRMVEAVRSDVQKREQQPAFFANASEKESFYLRVQKLFDQCQAYHDDVVSTSSKAHRARANPTLVSIDTMSSTAGSPVEQTPSSDTPLVSPVPLASSSDMPHPMQLNVASEPLNWTFSDDDKKSPPLSEGYTPGSAPETGGDVSPSTTTSENSIEHPAQLTHPVVAFALPDALQPQEGLVPQHHRPGEYHQMLVRVSRDGCSSVLDLRPHSLDGPEADRERSADELARVSHTMMNTGQTDFDGYRTLESTGPSWLFSFLSGLSADTSSRIAGGMV